MGNIDSLSPEVKKQIQRIYLSSYLLNKRVIDIKKLLQLKNLKKIELHDSIIENFEDIEDIDCSFLYEVQEFILQKILIDNHKNIHLK